MARTPILSALAALALVAFGLNCTFVSGPRVAETQPLVSQSFLATAASSSVAALAAAAPALAEEDPAEEYNRKVLTGASYVLILAFFLLGLIVAQARKVVENKWLN
eukprot:CAMPEP_0170590380 /NCGR_PEP_ID=MMETSP0224-20130122/11840_1 /TAXON_ID=285029 /ORGANISM="Togula jolla, Strain CCCM 725" /LENGTH=105 /DNA_ID=CAMNT_0010914175 /DNA_START=44 /DNA_END=361 /DNA_ORIENTATION=-